MHFDQDGTTWRDAALTVAQVLTTSAGDNARAGALEVLHRMAQLADDQTQALRAGQAALAAGLPVIWIHGRPFADPGSIDPHPTGRDT